MTTQTITRIAVGAFIPGQRPATAAQEVAERYRETLGWRVGAHAGDVWTYLPMHAAGVAMPERLGRSARAQLGRPCPIIRYPGQPATWLFLTGSAHHTDRDALRIARMNSMLYLTGAAMVDLPPTRQAGEALTWIEEPLSRAGLPDFRDVVIAATGRPQSPAHTPRW